MFIAHLPAGYLLTRSLQKSFKTTKYLWVGLVASILPDIDLIYFYVFDGRSTQHHEYITHLPLFWLAVWVVVLAIIGLARSRPALIISTLVFANIFLHLILDSMLGSILWLAPFSHASFVLATVPAVYSFWVWNFILHWTFLFEVAITLLAGSYFVREQHRERLIQTK